MASAKYNTRSVHLIITELRKVIPVISDYFIFLLRERLLTYLVYTRHYWRLNQVLWYIWWGELTWIGAGCTWIVPLDKVTVGISCVCAICELLTVERAAIPDDAVGCIITADKPAELTAAWRIFTCGRVCWICCKATWCTVSVLTWFWEIGLVFAFLGFGFCCHHLMRPCDGGSRSPPKNGKNHGLQQLSNGCHK